MFSDLLQDPIKVFLLVWDMKIEEFSIYRCQLIFDKGVQLVVTDFISDALYFAKHFRIYKIVSHIFYLSHLDI